MNEMIFGKTGILAGGAYAPYKRFAQQNLGAGRIHFARASEMPKGEATKGSATQKRKTCYGVSFLRDADLIRHKNKPNRSPAAAGSIWKGGATK